MLLAFWPHVTPQTSTGDASGNQSVFWDEWVDPFRPHPLLLVVCLVRKRLSPLLFWFAFVELKLKEERDVLWSVFGDYPGWYLSAKRPI